MDAIWTPVAAPPLPTTHEPWRRFLILSSVTLAALSPLWLYALFNSTNLYDSWSSYFMVPVIALANWFLIFRVTRRDHFLRRVMSLGMWAKLAATGAYLFIAFRVYHAVSDNVHYFYRGQMYAGDVLWNGHWPLLEPIWAQNSIYMLTGALVVALGPALPAISFIFALFAFWAAYFSYRALVTAIPEADPKAAALLLFVFPSLLFWTACIGKDAVIALFLALTVYGFARLNVRITPRAIVLFVVGLSGTTIVRPHVAAMVSIAAILPFLLGRSRGGLLGIGRVVFAPLLICAALYMAWRAQDFLRMESFSQASAVMREVGVNNNAGGSAFEGKASLPSRALSAPVLFFRPFPWEARSFTSIVAAAESLLLFALVLARRRQLLLLIRRWRTNPFGAFLFLFIVEFCLIYSAAVTNFGLLARQRVMALPMLLMLLSFSAQPRLAVLRIRGVNA
jgi:hypothetical protein